ncbi:hypothetical protein BsWGS_23070 [Bradybaena similaris]
MGGAASKTPKVELNFLLMGKTGNGKSTLGNCILGCKNFEVSASVTSHTRDVKCGYSTFQNYSLKVVDGPGLEDTQLEKVADTQKAITVINQALCLCSDGLDAVIFVFKFGNRFTKEEVSAIETLKSIFGEDYFKHAIVVLTGSVDFKDLMEQENFRGTFHDWCMQQTGEFKKLYIDTQKRFLFYNSFERNKNKQIAQREQLTTLAHDLKSRHGRYTAECFRLAAIERERLIQEHNATILKEDIQREVGILFSKIQEYIQTTNAENMTEIKEAIQTVKEEIAKEDKGKDVLADLTKVVSNVEINLDDKDKLLVHAKELDETRTAEKYWKLSVEVVTKLSGLKKIFSTMATGIRHLLKK